MQDPSRLRWDISANFRSLCSAATSLRVRARRYTPMFVGLGRVLPSVCRNFVAPTPDVGSLKRAISSLWFVVAVLGCAEETPVGSWDNKLTNTFDSTPLRNEIHECVRLHTPVYVKLFVDSSTNTVVGVTNCKILKPLIPFTVSTPRLHCTISAGVIPIELKGLRKLRIILLSDNMLSGELALNEVVTFRNTWP